MAPTFEPTTPKQVIDEISRRAKTANDKLCVIDCQTIMHAYHDLLIECTPERAASLHAKGMEAAVTRLRKKRCLDK